MGAPCVFTTNMPHSVLVDGLTDGLNEATRSFATSNEPKLVGDWSVAWVCCGAAMVFVMGWAWVQLVLLPCDAIPGPAKHVAPFSDFQKAREKVRRDRLLLKQAARHRELVTKEACASTIPNVPLPDPNKRMPSARYKPERSRIKRTTRKDLYSPRLCWSDDEKFDPDIFDKEERAPWTACAMDGPDVGAIPLRMMLPASAVPHPHIDFPVYGNSVLDVPWKIPSETSPVREDVQD